MCDISTTTLNERAAAARAALDTYAATDAAQGVTGPDLVIGLLADVLHAAAASGINACALLDRARQHVTEEAEATEADHIIGATVRLRVVSYAGAMDADSLREVLRIGIEAMAFNVEDEETTERVWPWARVEDIQTEHRHRADYDDA